MKLLSYFILMVLWVPTLVAQNILFVDSTSAAPNEIINFSVNISNSQQFSAFQLDIKLPDVLQLIDNTIVLSPIRKNDHLLSYNLINQNTLRLISFSPTGKNYSGNYGKIVTFSCKVKQMPGNYTLFVENPLISDSLNNNILTEYRHGAFLLNAPLIQISQQQLVFNSIPLGTTEERYINISNAGNTPLIITKFSSNLNELKFVDSTYIELQPNQEITKQVVFNPIKKGFINGKLNIASNSSIGGSKVLSVSGHAYAVNEIHAANIEGRSGYVSKMRLSINNMESFSAFEFELNIPKELNFIEGTEQLFRNKNHQLFVQKLSPFRIKVISFSNNNSTFYGNDGDIVELSFLINGNGGFYPIQIANAIISDSNSINILSATYNSVLHIAAPSLYIVNRSIDFGPVSILDTGKVNITIYNFGNDTLKLKSMSIENDKFFSYTSFPVTILPNESTNIQLGFNSSVKGTYNTKIKVLNNDYLANPLTLNVTAKAFAPNIMIGGNVSGTINDTIVFPIKISNTEAFTAFQLDVVLPNGVNLIQNSLVLSNRASASHAITYSFINAQKIRIIAYSLSQSLFNGDSGVVCTMKLKLNTSAGIYPIVIENGLIGNISNQNILSSIQFGQISILNKGKILGKVQYHNSISSPLFGVTVNLFSGEELIKSVLTNTEGFFEFNNLINGSYKIAAYYDLSVNNSGITSTDALLIRRYTVGLTQFDNIQQLAADVNGSSIINSTDALFIRKYIVGQINLFPAGNWIFESFIVNIFDSIVNQNIKGSLLGDVNGSYLP